MTTDVAWGKLRSDIYIRDKGMCWACNSFVELKDYDLGHLVDRVNGGHDDYDNLAVMHETCNLSKPKHQTLEECTRWKLTAFLPNHQTLNSHSHRKRGERTFFKNPTITPNRQELYNQQIAKIKPATICWIQGRPQGGAMWKVLPPPYRQEDIFTMRQTPLGAKDDGYSKVCESLQVIGGELIQDVNIKLGHLTMHISKNNDKLSITYTTLEEVANVGKREETVGMGKGQIPIEAWHEAKAQGISLSSFKKTYLDTDNYTPLI